MNPRHIVLTYDDPANVLKLCADVLAEQTQALTITVAPEGFTVSEDLHEALISALDAMNSGCATAISARANREQLKLLNHQRLVSLFASSSVCSFKANLIRDYGRNFLTIEGPELNQKDVSILINKMGFSTIEVYTEHLIPPAPLDATPRSWDEYIHHLEITQHRQIKDYFSSSNPKKIATILLDFTDLEPRINGTSRLASSLLDFIRTNLGHSDQFEVVAVIPPQAQNFFSFNYTGIRVLNSLTEISEIFDVGLAVTPLRSLERVMLLSECSRNLAVLHLDLIAVRSLEHLSQIVELKSAVELYMSLADTIVFISESSLADAKTCFALEAPRHDQEFRVIPLGLPEDFANQTPVRPANFEIPDDYVLVLGNPDRHKQVTETVQTLISSGHTVLSVGAHESLNARHAPILTERLSDCELKFIISKARVVIFPSLQEGFGLPILEVASVGTPLIVWNTPASREVVSSLGSRALIEFCDSQRILPEKVKQLSQKKRVLPESIRSAKVFNEELTQMIAESAVNGIRVNSLLRRQKAISILRVALVARRTLAEKIAAQNRPNRWKHLICIHRWYCLGKLLPHR